MAPILERRVAAESRVAMAKSEWLAAVADERALMEETHEIVTLYRQLLLLMFHAKPDALIAFGLSPRKPARALTAEERARKVERAAATRKARGTLGRRQRAKIHGERPTDVAAEE